MPKQKAKTLTRDYAKEIEELEMSIKVAQQKIQILKTKRKLEVLEDGGQLCSTCNGVFLFSYGNRFSKYYWAECEDCHQRNYHKKPEWSDDPAEWIPNYG